MNKLQRLKIRLLNKNIKHYKGWSLKAAQADMLKVKIK